MRAAEATRHSRLSLPLIPLLLLALSAASAASAAAAAAPRSAVVSELLGPTDSRKRAPAAAPSAAEQLRKPDPFDEFAEPRRLDWPEGGDRGRRRSRRRLAAKRIRQRLLWRMSRHPGLTAALAGRKPLPPHRRDRRLDRPDPYRELASEAYYRFVQAILNMRNRMVAMHGFDETSAIREFFEDTPKGSSNSTTTPAPTGGPEATPSPPVRVCPPRWRLGDHRCQANATFCYKDSECSADSRCCFDGCKLRCLEPELLVKHVCRDYTNSTVFPGDLYMLRREQICTCDELGRPQACKDKKPCIDVISSSLFKLPFISNKTAKVKKRERTTRQKIYDALQKAFKHVKKVY